MATQDPPQDPQPGASWTAPGWGSLADLPNTPPPPGPGAPAAPPGWGGPPAGAAPGSPVWGAPHGWGGPSQASRPGVVPLRPLGLGELLDGAVSVVRRYPRPTLGLSALVAVVSTLLNIALVLLVPQQTYGPSTSSDLSNAQVGGLAVTTIGSTVIGLLSGIVLTGVITVVIGRAVLGQSLTSAQAWAEARPRLAALLGLSLLTGLIITLVLIVAGVVAFLLALLSPVTLFVGVPLVLAAFIGAFYLYIRFALAAPALVLERTGVIAALRRSAVLVKGAFWRTLGILVLVLVMTTVVTSLLQLPFLVFTAVSTPGSRLAAVLSTVGAGLAVLITAPFSSGVTALLYIDRRMRAEGLDVTLAATAAAAGSPATPTR